MKYSRNQISKAGDILISKDTNSQEYKDAIVMVNEWRETHLPVLSDLNRQISLLLSQSNISYVFSSQRIKRLQSIIEKLTNNVTNRMKLGGLQDIGGLRYCFADIKTLDMAYNILKDFTPQKFKKEKICDYVSTPKESGYRSIHFIYKYEDQNDAIHDGLKIELQIRTSLQHSWAMAVETASIIAKTPLKANIDDNSVWREFFRIVSAVFAQMEHKPVYSSFQFFNMQDLFASFNILENKFHLFEQLETIRLIPDRGTNDDFKYCILILEKKYSKKFLDRPSFSPNTLNKFVYIYEQTMPIIKKSKHRVFSVTRNKSHIRITFGVYENDFARACRILNIAEQFFYDDEAVVMVSLEKMQELKAAYPSFFMDTEEFVKALKPFINNSEKC